MAVSNALNPSFAGVVTTGSQVVTTAGGAQVLSLGLAGLGLYFGSGLPTVTAAKGSLYMRTDGSSIATRMYVNTDGAATWTNVATAT